VIVLVAFLHLIVVQGHSCDQDHQEEPSSLEQPNSTNQTCPGFQAHQERRSLTTSMTRLDPCSLANLEDLRCSHVDIDMKVMFEDKQLVGNVQLHCKFSSQQNKPDLIVLDSNDLTIQRVSLVFGEELFPLTFSMGESPALGQGVRIDVKRAYEANKLTGEDFILRVDYHTSPNSIGIQWLKPEQTEGKQHPYLFTQFQPIHCRSAFPLQDSPSHKITYNAKIYAPTPLTALMSAISTATDPEQNGFRCFHFEQTVPVATYLIALVVGNLASAELGPRSRLWTEPEMLEKASYEFVETNDYLQTAEQLVSEYVWKRYDLLCLPPSFPYGGMENPCLTFVTPTLLAGDRSQTPVVAHEIAHSWTGNLVTNKNWDHFWLNEGFTVFLERKILGRLFGEPTRHFHFLLGNKDLVDEVARYGPNHNFTALIPKLEDINPDDAFGSIPYEKGSQFLFYLEQMVGPDRFEEILREWIVSHQYQSVDSNQFREFIQSQFPADKFAEIQWDAWYYNPGMPPVNLLPQFDDSLAKQASQLAKSWLDQSEDLPSTKESLSQFSSNQIQYFLSQIVLGSSSGLPIAQLHKLRECYPFSSTTNSEIRMGWLSLNLISKDESCFDQVVDFVSSQGRMKYVRPLYRLLAKCSPEGLKLAKETFAKNRGSYHNIASSMIEHDFAQINNQ